MTREMKLAIGLMSGTSLDGIDVALIRTDGVIVDEVCAFETYPYPIEFQKKIQRHFGKTEGFGDLEDQITAHHIQCVERFLQSAPCSRSEVDVIGFHGQTVFHDPTNQQTIQLGRGDVLAQAVGIDVVNDFRSQDVHAGGEGAPLVPIYHQALTTFLDKPVCVLNLGGVGNVTWIAQDGRLLAFDTGPGNALIDDWVKRHDQGQCDLDGAFAKRGEIDDDAVNRFANHAYFLKSVPKSLDRDTFSEFALDLVKDMEFEDGVATLSAFSIAGVMRAQDFFPELPHQWIVCGGGRHNKSIISALKAYLYGIVLIAEDVGWNGDATEAEAFAYLGVRSLVGLPITFPTTTGVKAPMCAGTFHSSVPRQLPIPGSDDPDIPR